MDREECNEQIRLGPIRIAMSRIAMNRGDPVDIINLRVRCEDGMDRR
jgi:hypothetical protein